MNPYIQYMYSYPHKTAYGPLKGIILKDYAPMLAGSGHGLYLHIPFCMTKCGYCNLFSVTGQKSGAVDRYLDAVEAQSRQYEGLLAPYETVFSDITIGGGTPLLLSEEQLERMFSIMKRHFNFSSDCGLTIETAPNQTAEEKLEVLKRAGVTRVSIGIQSFFDGELRTLQRSHSAARAEKALALLKAFRFPCVNVDFIYGIPGQTVKSLLQSLKKALFFEPDEIFLYPLYIKHGAGLERNLREGMVLNPELAFSLYKEASRFLKKEGFRQDSMRRFVRQEGSRSYLECGFGTSLALGCGGRSYLGKLHFCSPYAVAKEECLARLKEFESTLDFSEVTHGILLSEEEQRRRYVIRHLLIHPGLDLEQYKEYFGSEAQADFPLLKLWLEKGYAEKIIRGTKQYLDLTETGMGLSDYLGPQLISRQVRKNMEGWEELHGQTYDSVPGQLKEL